MARFRLLLVALMALGLMTATAACGTSSGSDSDKDSSASTTAASSDDGGDDDAGGGEFVTGTPEEWLKVVCGEDAEINVSDDDPSGRWGDDATEVTYCTPPPQPDGETTYPEAVIFTSDPSADYATFDDPEVFRTVAIGKVSDDEWAMVYEDNSTKEIAEPHLAGLTEFGFTVHENNEPVN